jgi:hypothetical protein
LKNTPADSRYAIHLFKSIILSRFPSAFVFGVDFNQKYWQVYMSLPNGSQPKSYELPLHGLSCTGLCVSVDGRSLVTVGEDWVSLAGNSLIGKSHREPECKVEMQRNCVPLAFTERLFRH